MRHVVVWQARAAASLQCVVCSAQGRVVLHMFIDGN
jgi:hypothetical protein